MGAWRRHAVYYAPPAGSPLAAFGAAWLGWDPESGKVMAGAAVSGLPLSREALVEAPARYGLHATLKAPFRLADGASEEGLERALASLAAQLAPFDLTLAPAWVGGFLALVPRVSSPALAALEAACVTELDGLRASLAPAEIARRQATRLTAAEEENLARWGYPYVLDRFRFHVTLTGIVRPEEQVAISAALAPHLAPLVAEPAPVAELCHFGEGADGRFFVISRHRFGRQAPPAPPGSAAPAAR